MAAMMTPNFETISDIKTHARQWLFEQAAPMWSTEGVCPDGLFAERISQDGTRLIMNRRLRVQARQVYSFCTLGELGWQGPWRDIVAGVIDQILSKGRRADGLFVHMFDEAGQVSNASVDLYDHAFGLFALAHAGRVLQRPDLLEISHEIQNQLDQTWFRLEGGFWEGELTHCPPYRQNPHMHMLEMAIAQNQAAPHKRWQALRDDLIDLFCRRFHDAQTGAVTEYFNKDWSRLEGLEGEIVEPGHCLEWAWLLWEASGAPGTNAVALSLVNFARRYGIDSVRGVVINEVARDGRVHDATARLWPQTERLKAAIAQWKRTQSQQDQQEIVAAYVGLAYYLTTPVAGLWWDRLQADGQWIEEPALASSFYHIVCAINELLNA